MNERTDNQTLVEELFQALLAMVGCAETRTEPFDCLQQANDAIVRYNAVFPDSKQRNLIAAELYDEMTQHCIGSGLMTDRGASEYIFNALVEARMEISRLESQCQDMSENLSAQHNLIEKFPKRRT